MTAMPWSKKAFPPPFLQQCD